MADPGPVEAECRAHQHDPARRSAELESTIKVSDKSVPGPLRPIAASDSRIQKEL